MAHYVLPVVAFVDILGNMRCGFLTDRDIQSLKSLSRPLLYPDGILPTELWAFLVHFKWHSRKSDPIISYPLRDQVHQCNISRLEAISAPLMYYQAMDFAGHDLQGKPLPASSAETLLERLVALKMLFLKVGNAFGRSCCIPVTVYRLVHLLCSFRCVPQFDISIADQYWLTARTWMKI